MIGKRGRLVADPFHQVAVAGDDVSVVINDLFAELGRQHPLGERHADRIADPLPKRPGRGLDSGRVPPLRMPGSAAAELPEALELVDCHVGIAGQVQQRIKEHRAVSGRQHEAVAVGPVRRLRIEPQKLSEQDGRDIGHPHRHARVSRLRSLDRIHGERSNCIRHAAEFRFPWRGKRRGRSGGGGGGAHHGKIVTAGARASVQEVRAGDLSPRQ